MDNSLCRSDIVIGRVGEESYPNMVQIISKLPIPLGTYVSIPFDAYDISTGDKKSHCVVGVISVTSYRKIVPVTPTFIASTSTNIGIDDENLRYAPSRARIFADIINGNVETPTVPPPPDTEIYLAPSHILSKIFGSGKTSSIKLGHLIGRSDVEINVDINALSKHLFITGTTGSGKSNTVAIIADRIASIGGTVLIFDVHGEYGNLVPQTPDVDIQRVDYRFNPLKIPTRMLVRMMIPEAGATRQRALAAKAIDAAKKFVEEAIKNFGTGNELIEAVKSNKISELPIYSNYKQCFEEQKIFNDIDEDMTSADDVLLELFKKVVSCFLTNKISESNQRRGSQKNPSSEKESALKALSKIEEFFDSISVSFSMPSIVEFLKPASITVLNVSDLTDEQKDYSLKSVMDELLSYAKQMLARNSPHPILVFIEEAHLFLSSSRYTISRSSIERVAREGRKFGLALAIVSQRPRNIDPNTVSQVQNFVFMKLVQEADQQAIMNISDMLTEDIAASLASLGVGEAIVLGEWIGRFPAYVKIDKHSGKRAGATLDIASIWSALKTRKDLYNRLAKESEDAYRDISNLI
ncbi:MAG: ATP-binding protein [Ignisphaera sp.]